MQRRMNETDDPRKRNESPDGLGPEDRAWVEEPSAVLDVSWIEDDLQDTPADELMSSEPVAGQQIPAVTPADPDIAFTPPPRRPPLRRPVVERIRSRAELIGAEPVKAEQLIEEAKRAGAPRERTVVRVERIVVGPSRTQLLFLYGGAIATGIATAAAILLLR